MKVFTSVPSENLYFQETTVEEGNVRAGTEMGIINVFDEFEYQSVVGFGGAFTESAAYNYAQLTDEQKKLFLENFPKAKSATDSGVELESEIDVYDLNGKQVLTKAVEGAVTTLPASALPNGMYIVKSGERTAKFIKK